MALLRRLSRRSKIIDPAEPVVTSTLVTEDHEPVRRVVHFHADGLWQFLANREQPDDQPVLIHVEHLLSEDPSLGEVAGLRPGQVALRVDRDRPWRILHFKHDAEFDEMLELGELE